MLRPRFTHAGDPTGTYIKPWLLSSLYTTRTAIVVAEVGLSMMASKSNAQCLAFRRLVCDFSKRFSKEERQDIVYIRLHDCRERYRDASNLDVLSKLEMCGVFSPSDPAGLIHVAEDIDRPDLVNLVEDFMKNQKTKSKGKKSKRKSANKVEKTNELCDKEMALVRPPVEVTLSQTSELALLVDTLKQAVESRERQKATEASQEAGRVVNKLDEHLEKVREALKSRFSPQSSSSSCSSTGEDTCKPPVQETCDDPAQTLASILNMAHKDKQHGIPMGDWQRKPTRWTKPTEYHSSGCSQSAPCSPDLGRDSSGRRKQRVKIG